MYLSRIELTRAIAEQSQLGLLLKDRSYGMHRLLWDLLDKDERFLFREETSQEQMNVAYNRPLYYLLSGQAPLQDSPIFKIETKHFEPALTAGDQLSFKLRANPTVTRREEGARNSKRHDVVMDAQRLWLTSACLERELPTHGQKSDLKKRLLDHTDFNTTPGSKRLKEQLGHVMQVAAVEWIKSRGANNGFELQTVQATAYRWNAMPEKGRGAGFSSMDYDGVLTVTQPAEFIKRLGKGLGPSKAFGCGLMLIRRA